MTGAIRGRGRGPPVRANVVQAGEEGTSASTELDNSVKNSRITRLDSEQRETLMTMFGKPKSNTSERLMGKRNKSLCWIIDSGATNHMVRDLRKLQAVRDISNCLVGLPNESQSFATKEGTIKIDEHLTLDNVLYVPGLTCHLISVSQL